jgi:dihydroorotate dehydrogenase electron transfer subunit
MTNPLHASYYADCAVQAAARVIENVRIAHDTYRLRFSCPEMARRIVPGQFLMLRLAGVNDPLIGRPLALYDTVLDSSGEPAAIDVVYLVKGKFTSRLATYLAGQVLDVWGPLGNGFEPRPAQELIMVAGGIGQTPFVALAQEALGLRHYGAPPRASAPVEAVTLCYGARSADLFAGLDDFERAGVEARLATDDGSRGHKGFVTDLLRRLLAEKGPSRQIAACGPEPMLEAVAKIALAERVPCQVSLETPMACGVGICFTCVAKVRDPSGEWDYKRTCVEGPVFDANVLEW